MITGTTKNLGVIGWPIVHSLSPVIQNAAIAAAGIDYVYTALPIKPDDLPAAVQGLTAAGFAGFNVTIPHKQAIMPYLDAIDDDAKVIGAVNTVVNQGGQLKGYNTDITGFLSGLDYAGIDVHWHEAVVLGAGGAARAVVWGLLRAGVSRLSIGVRNPAKAEQLAADMNKAVGYERVTVYDWQSPEFKAAQSCAFIVVNTTPLGMYPHVDDAPPVDVQNMAEGAVAYDVIYTPAETQFLRNARENGHITINGEHMLVGQGAAALKLWTGITPDTGLMRRVLREQLEA